jgi:hypothetical protein
MLAQHGAAGDIDRRANGVGADHLALEVLDLIDAAVLADIVLLAEITRYAVLELVGDHHDVVEAGVIDGDGKRRVGEVGDFQLVIGNRRDHRRDAAETDRFDHVGFAPMLGEVLLVGND